MHLKVIQTMTKIPRSVGIPPLSDQSFDRALVDQVTMTNVASSSASIDQSNGQASSSSSSSSTTITSAPTPQVGFSFPLQLGDDDGKINPLAGMGLTDEQYSMILQNLVSGENFMGIGGALDAMSMGAMGMGMMSSMSMAMNGMQGMQYAEGLKRGLDDVSDGRDGKRGRFEVIE